MNVLLFRKTTDADLHKGLKVAYQDKAGEYTQAGEITVITTIAGFSEYTVNGANYLASELKLIQQDTYRYQLTNQHCSSERLGNCEVCNKPVSEVFHQVEEKSYLSPIDNTIHWTHYMCKDYFGHKECLELKQKIEF